MLIAPTPACAYLRTLHRSELLAKLSSILALILHQKNACNRDSAAVQTNIILSMISAICASQLIQSGMSLFEVSNIFGHVDVQTTQRYAHLENLDVGRKARDIMAQMRV
jgi:site-specific recombinase XerD